MSEHEKSLQYNEDDTITVLCSCGWEDADLESEDDADLLHEQHVEAEATA